MDEDAYSNDLFIADSDVESNDDSISQPGIFSDTDYENSDEDDDDEDSTNIGGEDQNHFNNVGEDNNNNGLEMNNAYDAGSGEDDDMIADTNNTNPSASQPAPQSSWDSAFVIPASVFTPEYEVMKPDFNVDAHSSPFFILKKFINQDMVDEVIEESDRYVEQKQRSNPRSFLNWKIFDLGEYWRFVALLLLMGLVRKPRMRDYWATDPLTSTPFFATIMSRNRFLEILRSLHFVNNETVPRNNANRFIKLGNFLTKLLENFGRAIYPGEMLCLDETLLPYKGRLSFRQYNPKKRGRFGIKFFLLVDCATRFVLDVLPYQGKSTEIREPSWIKTLGFGGAAVMTMLQKYFNKFHKVVIDNWFNSPTLARILKGLGTFVLGTVQKRRKEMPRGVRMMRKMQKGAVEVFSDGDILIERWLDRREVLMLNSFMDHSMEESPRSANPNNQRLKPKSVLLYNKTMGAVDDVDKIIKPFESIRKTYKWYRKVAFHLHDIAVFNTQALYNLLHPSNKITYEAVVRRIISEIFEEFPPPARKARGRPATENQEKRKTGKHFPERVKGLNGKPSKSTCSYCKSVLNKRVSTQFRCTTCKIRLCIQGANSCFQMYHESNNLRPRVQTTASQSQPLSDISQTINNTNLSSINHSSPSIEPFLNNNSESLLDV